MTMDRQIEGRGSADYLWNVKNVVPFLKVDKGLADEVDGAQVMKPMPGLDALLARAVEKGVFGTKMRSMIRLGNGTGVQAVVDQKFAVGRQILAAGLVPHDSR
jgi:fructose-bisphosphate aldolase class I